MSDLDQVTYDASDSQPDTKQAQSDPLLDLHPPNPLPIIVRASDGKTQSRDRVKNEAHVKLSTVVQPDQIEAFFVRYAEVCKGGMQRLRKRDRSKRKKDKGKKKKKTQGKAEIADKKS